MLVILTLFDSVHDIFTLVPCHVARVERGWELVVEHCVKRLAVPTCRQGDHLEGCIDMRIW